MALKITLCALLAPVLLAWWFLVMAVMLLPQIGAIIYGITTGNDEPAFGIYEFTMRLMTFGR